MSWQCYSCGTKNPNSADTCSQCGGNVAAPSKFYLHWVFGSALFFIAVYMAGTFFGGILLEVAASPTESEIIAHAKADGAKVDSVISLQPDQLAKAKAKAIEQHKAEMSGATKTMLYWFLPVILVFFCGGIVGFISNGKTIIEVGIGSVIGQVGGYLLQRVAFQSEASVLAISIVVIIGIIVSMLGAWVGEILQGKRERAA